MLEQERLRELLNYDQVTGVFVWRINRKGLFAGTVAGQTDRHGHINICVDGKRYGAHRLAFVWMNGSWPIRDVDHRDGNPGNNSWANLREATTSQNLQNKRVQSNNKIGLKGVYLHADMSWRSRIKADGRHIHLGLFNCPAAAHFAYVLAAYKHFGEFARPQ